MNTDKQSLNFFERIYGKGTITTNTVKVKQKSAEPLISNTPDKLFELYGNLVLAGFSEDEALIIVVGIARNDSNK